MSNLNLDIALLDSAFNQTTKRYGLAKDPATGDVAMDDTQAFVVLTSAICRRNRYWANRNFGSDLAQLTNLTSRTPQQAIALVKDAEKVNVDDGLIDEPTVTAAPGQRDTGGNKLLVDINWTTPSGASGRARVAT